jgi:hypothetical protein
MSTQSSKAFLAKKNCTCPTCKKTYYAALGACPFCAGGRAVESAAGPKADAKNAVCFACRKAYYRVLGACPFCPQVGVPAAGPAGGRVEATPPGSDEHAETSPYPFAAPVPELAGSGSHRYADPGVTDWLDKGRPDHERRTRADDDDSR